MGSIVFVSGVGLWPGLMAPVVERVKVSRPTHVAETHNPLEALDRGFPPSMGLLLDSLRSQVEQMLAPVTLVAESIDATLSLALALDPPDSLGALVLHEPFAGAAAPALFETACHASGQLESAEDPVEGVQMFLERLMGSDTWARLNPMARGYTRQNARHLQQVIPQIATWSSAAVQPAVPTIVTAGRGSAPMWHRAAGAVAGGLKRHRSAGRGHLLSVDDPGALVEMINVATDAAEARTLEVFA